MNLFGNKLTLAKRLRSLVIPFLLIPVATLNLTSSAHAQSTLRSTGTVQIAVPRQLHFPLNTTPSPTPTPNPLSQCFGYETGIQVPDYCADGGAAEFFYENSYSTVTTQCLNLHQTSSFQFVCPASGAGNTCDWDRDGVADEACWPIPETAIYEYVYGYLNMMMSLVLNNSVALCGAAPLINCTNFLVPTWNEIYTDCDGGGGTNCPGGGADPTWSCLDIDDLSTGYDDCDAKLFLAAFGDHGFEEVGCQYINGGNPSGYAGMFGLKCSHEAADPNAACQASIPTWADPF